MHSLILCTLSHIVNDIMISIKWIHHNIWILGDFTAGKIIDKSI